MWWINNHRRTIMLRLAALGVLFAACNMSPVRDKCPSTYVAECLADGGAQYVAIDGTGQVFECKEPFRIPTCGR
jgi:hypothetical protein